MKYFNPKGRSTNINIYFSGTYGHYMFKSSIKFRYKVLGASQLNAHRLSSSIKVLNHRGYSDVINVFAILSQTLPWQIPCFLHLKRSIPVIPNKCNDCIDIYDIYKYHTCHIVTYSAGCKANSTIKFSVCTNRCNNGFIIIIQPRERYRGVATMIILDNTYHGKTFKIYVREKSYIKAHYIQSDDPDFSFCDYDVICELAVFIEMSISDEELQKFQMFTPSLIMTNSTQMSQWQGFEYLYMEGVVSWEKG